MSGPTICTACGAKFRLPDSFKGGRVKCPKCAEVLAIPASGAAAPPSTPRPQAAAPPSKPKQTVAKPRQTAASSGTALPPATRKPAAARAPSGSSSSVGSIPSFDAPAKKTSSRPASPTKPQGGQPMVSVGDETSSPTSRVRSRKKNNNMLFIVGGVAALALVLVVVAVAVTQTGNADDQTASNSNNSNNDGTDRSKPKTTVATAPNKKPSSDKALVVLDWPAPDRTSAALEVDKERIDVPESGPVKFEVAPGMHHILIKRRGFEHYEVKKNFAKGTSYTLEPKWQAVRIASNDNASNPAPSTNNGDGFDPFQKSVTSHSFHNWTQDLEEAKRLAASEDKEILIAFNGSDWCPWCVRLMQEIFFKREFEEWVDSRYVLVSIDFPRSSRAKATIRDPKRNRQLATDFGIEGYPTVIVADAQGRPYGREGYVRGGVTPFREAIEKHQERREKRDELLSKVETLEEDAQLAAAEAAVEWLKDNKLLQYYGETLKEWSELAEKTDPGNEKGKSEIFFASQWSVNAAMKGRHSLTATRAVIAELEKWLKNNKFKDADRAGQVHLIAGGLLMIHKQQDEAAKFGKNGLALNPKESKVVAGLRRLVAVKVLGSGSGYAIADGGYILTNHHVIKGEGKVVVSIPGIDNPVPAKVLAQNEDLDIALIKIEEPENVRLKPLVISHKDIRPGMQVGAFGYPLGNALGAGLKFTEGRVSGAPEAETNGMLIYDGKVNPGNSGGPLCNKRGEVVGMVTAKTRNSDDVDSYGMARPNNDLIEFLAQHLPDTELAKPDVDSPTVDWDEVYSQISPSVLMILKTR